MIIDITSNLDEVSRELTQLQRTQIPYATSLAMNSTIRDVRKRIVNVTWEKAFTTRNKAFPGVVFKMKFSRKGDLEAVLYDQLGREFITRHATGGVKRPTSGSNLAIPVNITRGASGRIPKSKRPRAITAKKSTRFIKGKSGKTLIIEQFKGESIVRYVLAPSAKIDKSFRFYEDAMDTFNRVIDGHWNSGLRRAMSTSRFFTEV